MKFLFTIIALIFTFSIRASDLIWPQDLYRIDTLNTNFFMPVKNYFSQLITVYPIQYRPNGFRLFDNHQRNRVLLDVNYENKGIWKHINYRTFSGRTFRVSIKSDSVVDMHELGFFKLDKIIQNPSFEIHLLSINYQMTKTTVGRLVEMRYRPEWGTVHLNETTDENFLESRMWFYCERCSGEPLIFVASKNQSHMEKRYFTGKLVEEVSPQKFLEIAGRWYLSSITRQSKSVLKKMFKNFDFPKINE